MGQVIDLATRKPIEPKGAHLAPPEGLERTPELALIMALLAALPMTTRKQVLKQVEGLREHDPHSAASLGALFVAAKMAKER